LTLLPPLGTNCACKPPPYDGQIRALFASAAPAGLWSCLAQHDPIGLIATGIAGSPAERRCGHISSHRRRVHLATGEPVGSRNISRHRGALSPAPVRNVIRLWKQPALIYAPLPAGGTNRTGGAFRRLPDEDRRSHRAGKRASIRIPCCIGRARRNRSKRSWRGP